MSTSFWTFLHTLGADPNGVGKLTLADELYRASQVSLAPGRRPKQHGLAKMVRDVDRTPDSARLAQGENHMDHIALMPHLHGKAAAPEHLEHRKVAGEDVGLQPIETLLSGSSNHVPN